MKKLPATKTVSSKRKAVANKARILKSHVEMIGLKSRLKGHVSATTRRSQAKRDKKRS